MIGAIIKRRLRITRADAADVFHYVSINTVPEIYGKNAITLTSSVAQSTNNVADSMTLSESRTTATSDVVNFTNTCVVLVRYTL